MTGSTLHRRWSLRVPALVLGLALAACGPAPAPTIFPAGDPAHPITIAVSPVTGLSPADGAQLAARLEQSTGFKFRVTSSPSSASAVAELGSGTAQIAWLDPLGYAVAHKRYGADVGLVAVRRGSDHFSSQIIANARTGLKGPGDVRDRTFCFAAAASTENYAIPRIILQANGVDPTKNLRISRLDLDEQIAAAVYRGEQCVAGATVGDARAAIQKQFPDAMDKIVVLEASPDIPNDAIVFVRDFPADVRGRIADALEALVRTPDGRDLLRVEGLVRREDSAYNRLRDLLTKAAADPANYIQ
jgi:phosphonate transport system substrate-binding protein